MPFYAHTDPNSSNPEDWEPLFTPFGDGADECQRDTCEKCATLDRFHGHLNKVAWWTAKFAAEMFPPGPDRDAAWQWGYVAGLWHDLGKFHPDFQRKLNGERLQMEHAGAGAALARKRAMVGWEVLSFVIAGHHSGLPNLQNTETLGDILSPLTKRLDRAVDILRDCERCETIASILFFAFSAPLPSLKKPGAECATMNDFVRLLFSALVDADSLATEAFCARHDRRTQLRLGQIYDSPRTLLIRFDERLDEISRSSEKSPVNGERARILSWCREAATMPTGFFQLNVPTGGGKTFAAMAFALSHIQHHGGQGLRRVLITVPYTSIIEQNAGHYREILGAHNVIEHHSNLDDFAEKENEADDELTIRRRLACENWDAPIVVTTNVQLFESLFAHKRRRTRKLHNLAGSVIVLDEAQCVPAEYLQLILSALRDLVENYGCTVVVSTATQPAWKQRRTLPFGIPPERLHPIVPNHVELAKAPAFDRVAIIWPDSKKPITQENLAAQLAAERCVMAIIHRKKDAQLLAKDLQDSCSGEPIFHLSTNMCPVHRRQVLAAIRTALHDFRQHGTPCRVVSTQLVEAGVDLDFPVIYRALAGLDSIAQAAGRCNREGKLARQGRVVVFIGETDPPDGHLKHCAEVTRKMLDEYGGSLDLRSAAVFEEFFVRLYRDRDLDAKKLVRHARDLNFETLGREFRLIENGEQTPVVVLFDAEARDRLRRVEQIAEHSDEILAARFALRALQPYTVLVRPTALKVLSSILQPLFKESEVKVLDPEFYTGTYDPVFGLSTDDEPRIPPQKLQV